MIIALYALSVFLCLAIVAKAYDGRNKEEIRAFGRIALLEAAWGSCLLGEFFSGDLSGKRFWDGLEYPLSLAIPVALLALAMRHSGRSFRRPRLSLGLLLAPSALSALMALADPWTGWLRVSPRVDWSVDFGEYTYGFTAAAYALMAASYSVAIAAIFLLARNLAGRKGSDLKRSALLMAGFLVPACGMFLIFLDVRVMGRRDVSPLWFTLGNIPIAWALRRYGLFDVLPLARKVLVEILDDPVFMLEADGTLADCNLALTRLLGRPKRLLRGRKASDAFSTWPPGFLGALEGHDAQTFFRKYEFAGDRYYAATVTPVLESESAGNRTVGHAVVLRDVTELSRAERALRLWNSELEDRISERTRELEREVERRADAERLLSLSNAGIRDTQREIMITLSEVVETRSRETAHHVLRVGEYARVLSGAFGLPDEETSLVADAAPMHDVGKIAVPDSILNKPGPLSEAEMAVMRTHSMVGYRILCKSERPLIRAAAVIALEHHERWDGSGYPDGKSGESISLYGRIVGACDVFDALVMHRVYKDAWEIARVMEYFRLESGRSIDPAITRLLFLNLDRFLDIAARYPDSTA